MDSDLKSLELQEHRLNSERAMNPEWQEDCFKASVLAISRKCRQMVGCPKRRWEQGVGEEERKMTQEGIGTRLWSLKGCLVLYDVHRASPASGLFSHARWLLAALCESTGSLVHILHCTKGSGHQLCTQKPVIG